MSSMTYLEGKLVILKIKEKNIANYISANKYLINSPLNKFNTKL